MAITNGGRPVLYGAVVFALGLIATPTTIKLMRYAGIIDFPNDRSSHTRPTVGSAGLGVALVAEGALVVAAMNGSSALFVVALGAGAYATLGMLDDLWNLSALRRLPTQLLVGVVAVIALDTSQPWYLGVLAIVGVVGYLNAFNFMDGINGISGLHALGLGATWTAAGVVSGVAESIVLGSVIGAAAAAFLPYNFPRARGFLGDVGSYFFGGSVALAAVALYGDLPLPVIVLPMAPYVADTTWTLLRRVRRGDSWYEAHREHVYQRLLSVGWSHARSALLVGALTVVSGVAGLLIAYILDGVAATTVVLLVVLGLLAGYLALPFLIGEQGPDRVAA